MGFFPALSDPSWPKRSLRALREIRATGLRGLHFTSIITEARIDEDELRQVLAWLEHHGHAFFCTRLRRWRVVVLEAEKCALEASLSVPRPPLRKPAARPVVLPPPKTQPKVEKKLRAPRRGELTHEELDAWYHERVRQLTVAMPAAERIVDSREPAAGKPLPACAGAER